MIYLLGVIAYLLGSIPFAIIVAKIGFGVDIRQHGSGNPGATNSVRVLGKKAGLIVLLGDASKGIIATLLPILLNVDVDPMYIGFLAVLGHCFPIFAGFRGGKAVATTAGVLLTAHPLLFLIGYGTFFLVVFITKYVSLGSMSIGLSLLIYSLIVQNYTYAIIFALFFLFLIYLHRSNVRNLINKCEPKVNDKSLAKDRLNKNN